MHLDEEQLQRLLHGELNAGDLREARDHLAECSECRDRLVMAERDESEIFGLPRQVDHPVPAVDAGLLVVRARGIGSAWGRWAAGILLFLGAAGAAYAVPGSPVREWIQSAAGWTAGNDRVPSAPRQTETPPARAAGIAAAPGKDYVIAFQSLDSDRLLIDNQVIGATFEIEIPRSAPRVEICVAGKRIFLKQGERVAAPHSRGVEGTYVIGLSPPGH